MNINPIEQNPVEILVIADRSGSMSSIKDDAIGGFNTFLEQQQQVEGDANLSLILFDHEYETPIESKPLHEVSPLTEATFVPRGSTAMYDAIGRSLQELHARNPEKAIVCILTDGLENSSSEFNKDTVKSLIEQAEEKGWQVVYLGANQDAFAEGSKMGIRAANINNYEYSSKGIIDAYSTLSASTASYRTNTGDAYNE